MQHNRFILAPVLFLSLCFFSFLGAEGAEAKSVMWNDVVNSNLSYCWTNGSIDYANCSMVSPTDIGGGLLITGWGHGLANPNVSIVYKAKIFNDATNQEIPDGSSVPVGTVIRIERDMSSINTDISWFGVGYSTDSPYGNWTENASYNASSVCSPSNYVGVNNDLYIAHVFSVYAPLSVNPPPITYSKTGSIASLSCNSTQQICTVTSPGMIQLQINFSNTYGKFYYGYIGGPGVMQSPYVNVCMTNNFALREESYSFLSLGYSSVVGSDDYTLNIPQQTITFNLTAVGSSNTAPTPPTITGPIVGNTSTLYAFSAQASDPDGDTLRYGIDWDMNGSVDEWAPALSYVASNTVQSANHSWLTAGPQTFQILAQDSNGASSAFTSHTITLSTVVNGLCGVANGIATSTIPTLGLCASGTNTPVTGTGPWAWTCLGSGGGIDDLSCAAPYVAPPTLKICETSCNGALDRTGQIFTVAQNTTRSLTACYNTAVACTDASGDVTASATWTDTNAPRNIISFPVKGSLQAGTPAGTMSENFSVSYLSETKNATAQVTCVPLTCISAKSVTDTYCPEESQDTGVSNGCGSTLNCPGTRFCDTNYREVEP